MDLLEALYPCAVDPDTVHGLIEPVITGCAETFLRVRFLYMLREMASDEAARKVVDRRIVTMMIAHAGRMPGATKLAWLTDAATVARNAGLADLYEDTTLQIQNLQKSDLGLVPTGRVVVRVTQQEMDAALALIDEAPSLADALWRIVGTQPPAGTIAAAQQEAREAIRAAPLASLIPCGALNPAGPVPVGPPSGDTLADVQAECQLLTLNKAGLVIAAQLDRVRERFDPGEADLAAIFDHATLGSDSKVRMLVHAFMYYFIGHEDAAVHMALPRVEALLREIERGRNVPVLAVAKRPISGGGTQLGGLIDHMPAAGFNEDWTSSVKLLLTDGVRGLNLRNDVSHGLSDCPPRIHVALVLHAALLLLAVVHGVIALPQPLEPTITTSGDDD